MTPTRLAEVLQYPPVWLTTGLLCEELVALQAPQVAREYGLSTPTGGTEHWRYGAFRFWLHRKLTLTELESLLEAAVADPDPPMAGNVLKEIASHALCTPAILKRAQACVAGSPYYYVQGTDLERLFGEKGPGV